MTNIDSVDGLVVGSIESSLALVAIDAVSVVLTVQTFATTTVLATNVHAQLLLGDLFIEDTILRVAITVTLFTNKRVADCGTTPFVLMVSGTTLFTLRAASVVLTRTGYSIRIVRELLVTLRCMTIAHTTPTNADVFDGVEILKKKQISLRDSLQTNDLLVE